MTSLAFGGFVGVDVFFVISGYLITATFENDLKSGISGIAAFYRRRILRIFPALFAVFLACWVMEIAIRFPQGIGNFQRSLLSAIFFVSNINFWLTSDYFDFASRDNALLHTWSLSVEEQFYFLLPLLFILSRRLSAKARLAALLLSGLASLVAAQLCLKIDGSAAFYLVPFRIWEFLIGSALSLKLVPRITNRVLAEALGIIGLGLILAASLFLQQGSPFPGINAVAPVLGTAFVLAGTEYGVTIAGRLLSLWPARIIGLSSYSLYLWHWPVLVYAKYVLPSSSKSAKILLIGLCVLIALASWRFIEQPFRRAGRRATSSRVLWSGLIAMIVLAGIGLMTTTISRYAWPENPGAEAALQTLQNDNFAHYRKGTCFTPAAKAMAHRPICLALSASRRNVLILGDSHAAQLWYGYSVRYPHINFLQATAENCTPILSFGDPACDRYMTFILDQFLPRHHLDAVIISGRWQARDLAALHTLTDRLAKYAAKVVLVGPFQEYPLPFAEIVARARYAGKPDLIDTYRDPESIRSDQALHRFFSTDTKVDYISAVDVFCPKTCVADDRSGKLLMFDNQHLTSAGSLFFAQNAPLAGF